MKRLLSLLLSAALCLGCIAAVPAFAADADKTLRVGLNYGSTALDTAQLENVSGYASGYSFGTISGTTFTAVQSVSNTALTMKVVNGAVQATDTDTGAVLYTAPAGEELAIRPNSTLTWFKGYKWYGNFGYRITGSKLTVINYVQLEDYVKGVLPYEVNADWPSEALKAQAVCARSFALGTTKHAADGFDLCNTENCQVYLGANQATANSDAAVDATRGEHLSYNGEPVIGYFFSSDGGATEDAVNVWGGDYPYLKGKVDPYEDVENAYKGVWSVTLTAAEVKQKLIAAGYTIGDVVNVAVTRRTATDNVNEVTVTDSTGKTVTISRSSVRTVFGLNSIRYTITPNTQSSTAAAVVKAANTAPTASLSTHNITVDGKSVSPQGYYIKKGAAAYGENYFKLRDIAYILNGTDAQFNVTWDGANNHIELTTGTAYEAVGGEMASGATAVQYLSDADAVIVLNGKTIDLTGYRINGNNYFRVRDIADALGFGIDYDNETRTVLIDSGSIDPEDGAQPQTPAPTNPQAAVPTDYTFNGTGWGHSVGMSQYGAYAMAQQGKNYEDILTFYFTGVSIAK